MSYPPILKPNVCEKANLKDDLETREWVAFMI